MTSGRSRLAAAVLIIAAAVVVVAAVTIIRVLRPPSVTAGEVEADAVVVLAGGRGERLQAALRLMDSQSTDPQSTNPGTVKTLVVSTGNKTWAGRAERDRLCREPQDFTVVCREVSPDNTRGEASGLSALAEQEGWNSIALVTSTYHLHRATVLFGRCFDGTIVPVEATADTGWGRGVHEMLGIWHATGVDRGCGAHTMTDAEP